MKKRIGFVFVAPLLLAGLAGCSMTGENYYTINIYSDYVGMEEDLAAHGYYTIDVNNPYAGSGLKKVGYCYAVKGKDAKIGGIQLVDSSFNGRTSSRTAEKGHKYSFKGFEGYYGANQKIDVNHIQSDCVLFATFDYDLEDYLITARDAYETNLFNGRVLFNQNAKDLTEEGRPELEETLLSSPVHDPLANPNDYSTWRDPHYKTYAFDKWRFSIAGKSTKPGWTYDSSADRSRIDLTKEEALEYRFEEQTRIDARYTATDKSYQVNISYQVRTYNEVKEKYEYTAPVSKGKQTVLYGQPIDIDALGLTGYTCIGEGKDGIASRYGDDMKIAAKDLRKKLPSTLCELYEGGYRGSAVDHKKIEFGCTVTLLFTQNVPVYNLTFHPDFANPAATEVVQAAEGDTYTAPTVMNIPAGKIFADWGVKDETDKLVPVNITTLAADTELFPILIDETMVIGNLAYKYFSDRKGYCLFEVAPTLTEITAADFDLTAFPEFYPLVGISSFAGPTGMNSEKLTRIELPADNQIAWVSHGALTHARLDTVEEIDFSHSEILALHSYAFRNLPRLATVRLPASLYEVGSKIFQNCTSMNLVTIPLTKDEIAERAFALDWFADVDEAKIQYGA